MVFYPDPNDQLWNYEIETALGYLRGFGCDIGCGRRTPFPHLVTVDIMHPEAAIHAPADQLPFPDGHFDFLLASHVMEHTENPLATGKEWLRVVKPLGHVIIIHPDRRGTPWRGTKSFDSQHKGDYVFDELYEVLRLLPNATIVNKEKMSLTLPDGRPWSFKVVLRKHG